MNEYKVNSKYGSEMRERNVISQSLPGHWLILITYQREGLLI